MKEITVIKKEPEFLAYQFSGFLHKDFIGYLRRISTSHDNISIHWVFNQTRYSDEKKEIYFDDITLIKNGDKLNLRPREWLIYSLEHKTLERLTDGDFNRKYKQNGGNNE